jgi:ubiquinone/menaquinone biosynthesis C-methylase UbiE
MPSQQNLYYDLSSFERQESMRDPYRQALGVLMAGLVDTVGQLERPLIYEIGTGLGTLGKAMPEDRDLHIVGSDQLVEVTRIASSHYDSSVSADAEAIPFKDDSLDMIIGFDSLHWVLRQKKAMGEFARTLKTDASAVFIMGASLTTFFVEDEGKVILPTLWSTGNIHVEETDRTTYDEITQSISAKPSSASESAQSIGSYFRKALEDPNLVNGLLLYGLPGQLSDEDRFILEYINLFIRDEIIKVHGHDALKVFDRKSLENRYRTFLVSAALESGLKYESTQILLRGQEDTQLPVNLFCFTKTQ